MTFGDLSAAKQRRLATTATTMLPAGASVRGVALGRAHARWSNGATILGAFLCGVAILLTVLTGRLFVPGGIFFAVLIEWIVPRRIVAYCDQGIATLSVGLIGGRPKQLVALVAHSPLAWSQAQGSRRLVVGTDVVKLPPRPFARLAAIQSLENSRVLQPNR